MNLNTNNLVIGNSTMAKVNFKTMIMGNITDNNSLFSDGQ